MKKLWFLVVFFLGLSIGLVGNEIINAKKASAATKAEYKVIMINIYKENLQNELNNQAEKGWRLHTANIDFVIFEK